LAKNEFNAELKVLKKKGDIDIFVYMLSRYEPFPHFLSIDGPSSTHAQGPQKY
jgi:hypothetical protein